MFETAYELALNFHKKFYDFYDWNKEDNIITEHKIPVYKVSEKTMYDLLNNDFEIEESFFEKAGNNIIIINWERMSLAINKKGLKSSLQIGDQKYIEEVSKKLKAIKIPYKIIKENKSSLTTRFQEETPTRFRKKIKKLFEENNVEKIKYIYYEAFEEQEKDVDVIKKNIRALKDLEKIEKLENIINELERK